MILGIIILAIGILYLITTINPDFVVDYSLLWPGALILFCVCSIIKNKRLDMVSSIGVFVGTLILGVNANWFDKDIYKFMWPGVLIIIGISIILSSILFNKNKKKTKKLNIKDGILTYSGIFAGIDEKVTIKDFKGAIVYSIFGGVELDLRSIEPKEDIVINVYSIFGGTTLLLPKDYNVKVNSTAIIGGSENKSNNQYSETQKTIYINTTSVFGGCEIK